MSIEKTIITVENQQGPRFVLITDDHWTHIKSHLQSILKPGMVRHIWHHIVLARQAKKMGVPHISTDQIIAAVQK